jgi:hypothetical protein
MNECHETEGQGEHKDGYVKFWTPRNTTIYVPKDFALEATLAVLSDRNITLTRLIEVTQ